MESRQDRREPLGAKFSVPCKIRSGNCWIRSKRQELMKAAWGMFKKAKGQSEEPKRRKTSGERRLRHASRVAKPKRPVVMQGRSLDDDRQWMDW
jgi:hypothetical protein